MLCLLFSLRASKFSATSKRRSNIDADIDETEEEENANASVHRSVLFSSSAAAMIRPQRSATMSSIFSGLRFPVASPTNEAEETTYDVDSVLSTISARLLAAGVTKLSVEEEDMKKNEEYLLEFGFFCFWFYTYFLFVVMSALAEVFFPAPHENNQKRGKKNKTGMPLYFYFIFMFLKLKTVR